MDSMDKEELLRAVGQYIDRYYLPWNDDIRLDTEMESIFDRISRYRERKAEVKAGKEREPAHQKANTSAQNNDTSNEVDEFEIIPNAAPVFDESSMRKFKITRPVSEANVTQRNFDDLMDQMEETFSQRLLRMIDERQLKDAEVYTKAYVDRRHFSKIKKDAYYTPNKKTVLAFAIALKLSLDETKDLLGSAGYALSRSSKTDIIVAYFLQNQIYDMFEINEVLYAYDQPIFE